MRYVVASSNSDGRVRVFGSFQDKTKAEELAERVNDKIERQEEEDYDAWRENKMEGVMPDGYGRCGVLLIHKWSVKRAYRFALGEYDS